MARILIVDDTEDVLRFLEQLVSKMGHDVTTAKNGAEALTILEDEKFPIIISDLVMPGELSGMDLISEFRKQTPDAGIAIISGYPSGDVFERCSELGVVEFLSKPFELSFIRDVIERMLA